MFLAVDEGPDYFSRLSRGHFIYTPRPEGLGPLRGPGLDAAKAELGRGSQEGLYAWLRDFCLRNSYEISIPALRDPALAPPGKTGLALSLLFDGELFRMLEEKGLLEPFTQKTVEFSLEALEESLYPGLRAKILFMRTSTPLAIAKRFLSRSGAITGWSLEEKAPVASSLLKVFRTVRTAIPSVWKAGQWSYSPSGVPIAILSGRIAAAAMSRRLCRS
jgi:phytoene dehydrogenase-like protein